MQKILKKLAFYFLVYSIGLIAMNGLSAVRQMHTPRPASAPLFNLEMKRIENTAKSGTHGTAKRLQGRTAIVSVFASDPYVKWNCDRQEDLVRYSNAHRYLGIAAGWIMDQAAHYNVKCEFVWDWMSHHCLYRSHTFSGNMVSYDSYSSCRDYIEKEIPTDEIMRELDAENILYVIFFNTPQENMLGSCAWPYHQLQNGQTGYECVYLFTGEFNQETTPGTYAHEILHLFGVPDMYSENKRYRMSEAFIRTYRNAYPRDIMAGAMSYVYDYVEFTFSPLVAYYAGLTSSCDLVDRWDLLKSDYILYGF